MARNETTYTSKSNLVAVKISKGFDFDTGKIESLSSEILHEWGRICVASIRDEIKNGFGDDNPYDSGVLWDSIHYVVGGETDANTEMGYGDDGVYIVRQVEFPALKSGIRRPNYRNTYDGKALTRLSAEKGTMRVGTTLPYAYQVEFGTGIHKGKGARRFMMQGIENARNELKTGAISAVSSWKVRTK